MSEAPLSGGAGPSSREPERETTGYEPSNGKEGCATCLDGSRIRVKGLKSENLCFRVSGLGFRV